MLFDKCNGLNALDLVHAFSKGRRSTDCTTPEKFETNTEQRNWLVQSNRCCCSRRRNSAPRVSPVEAIAAHRVLRQQFQPRLESRDIRR
jgi:hypothetical protein